MFVLLIAIGAVGGAIAVFFSNCGDDESRSLMPVQVRFSYARFPEPSQGSAEEGVANGYLARHPEYRHEHSERALLEMFNTLGSDAVVRKVFLSLAHQSGRPNSERFELELMENVRSAEFAIIDQPKDANPIRGIITVRSSSEAQARAIAGKYAELLRQLVEDETQMRIDKSTMLYYSDYHKKEKELKIIKEKLSHCEMGAAERRSVREDFKRVEDEMAVIEAEWKMRAETIRKDSGGSIIFLDDPNSAK